MRQVIWHEPAALPEAHASLHADPLLGALLYGRGFRDPVAAARFLQRSPSAPPDPYQVPGMDAAVARVIRAIQSGETIAIFGDYDVDGVTSTALLVLALRGAMSRDSQVMTRLPTRDEGYGLSRAAIDDCAGGGAQLLIAVDCGSSDHQQVAYALGLGLDVVVLDHHQMADGDRGPEGAIVVSAQRLDDPAAPARDLAAVGLAYLLASALAQEGYPLADGAPETDLQDLVALGTIGDVAPLGGINRALVRDGLDVLRARPRPGIAALCRVSEVSPANVDAEVVSFRLAPRLNAAGRMSHPDLALNLLLAEDAPAANRLAAELDALNTKRKIATERLISEAERCLVQDAGGLDHPFILVTGSGWNAGLLGIVAARMAERYGRPALVLNDDGNVTQGSARSVSGIDITAALASGACRGLLSRFGGHGQAAGLALASADLPTFRSALAEAVLATGVRVPVTSELHLDAELPAGCLTLDTARTLAALEPFGVGNEKPLLLLRDAAVSRYTSIGRDRSHLKLFVRVGRREVPVLAWGSAKRSPEFISHRRWDLALTLGEDHWNGQPRLQVVAKDLRPSHGES